MNKMEIGIYIRIIDRSYFSKSCTLIANAITGFAVSAKVVGVKHSRLVASFLAPSLMKRRSETFAFGYADFSFFCHDS